MQGPLGRRAPTDWTHVERFPLTASVVPAKPVPVVVGLSWYRELDRPQKDSAGNWWVARNGKLTTVRGGHCVCLKPKGITDRTAWWRFYDQGKEGACFPAGTLIEMADGSHKHIEDVRPLDQVRSAEGNERTVLASMVRFHSDGLIHLKLRGHAGLRATAEHPVLTRNGYVPLAELRIGDEVRLPAVLREGVTHLETRQWVTERETRIRIQGTRHYGVAGRAAVTTYKTPVPERIALDAAFGRIVGLWLAEGSTTENKVLWTFGGHERDTLVAELMELLRDLGCEPRLQVRPNGVLIVNIYGKGWRLLFERMLSHGPYDKSLPPDLADGPREFLQAVLSGWLDGDGHRRRGIHAGVTISHRLALAMYRIGQGLGLAPAIQRYKPSPNRHAATRQPRWEVAFAKGQRAAVEKDAVWRKVTALEHEDFAGFVFNLEVESDHSYVAEGIGVHNCVGFGSARMMTLLNRRRYDARWLWNAAKVVDEWPDTNPGDDNGTSVRAACDVLRTQGLERSGRTHPDLSDGISENRWALSIPDVLGVLGTPGRDYCELLNSWGTSYPQIVRIPAEVLDRLRREDGEFAIVTDR